MSEKVTIVTLWHNVKSADEEGRIGMEQLDFFDVPSPCVGVCTVDDKGYCQGCMRKREERFNWLSYTVAEKQHIIKLCRQRYLRKVRQGKLTPQSPVEPESPQRDLF
ncbi:hypothetical protein Vpro01_04053 [Vibrio proteolyticus]